MPILYALIARGPVVLAEYSEKTGNFPTVTRVLLGKIDDSVDCRKSIKADEYTFHFVVEGGLTYLCMTDVESGDRLHVVFGFIDAVRQKFRATFGPERGRTAIAFELNQEFAPALAEAMAQVNAGRGDAFAHVSGKLDAVKEVMVQNIETVMDRGEKLELLVDKSERLQTSAFTFERSSRKLRDAMFWKKVKAYLLMGGVMAVLAYIISVMACGFDYAQCRDDDDSKQRRLLSGLRLLLR